MGVLAGCTSSKTIASVSNPLFPTWHLDAEPTSLLTIFSLCRQLSTRLCQKGVPEGTGERENFPPIPVNVRLTHSPPAADEFTSGFSNLSNLPVTLQRPQHKRLAPSFSVTWVPYYGAPLQAQSHQHE